MSRWDRGHYDLEVRAERSPHLDDDERDPFQSADMLLTRNIAVYVNNAYPGHPWFIAVSHYDGIVKINLPALMKQNYFIVPIRNLHSDPGFKQVLKGCGEILERYLLPRAGYSHVDYQSALDRNPPWMLRNNTPVPTG